MLYLESPVGPFHGVCCFRDSADRDLFHYVAERPRLARNDGTPEFVFLIYENDITDNPTLSDETRDELGGGYLAFTVDLSIDEETLKDVRKELARFSSGEPKLSPILFRDGTVRLSIDQPGEANAGSHLVEHVYGTSKSSLIGANRATFAVTLDHESALLFEAGFRSGVSPIGVIYADLEFLGLTPAFNVKITADYDRIYDHLELQFGAKAQVYMVALAADVDVAFQKLRDAGHIKVEVTNFTDDEDLRKQADEAFAFFKTELIKDFFQSALQPPSFMKEQAGGGLLGAMQGLLGGMQAPQQAPGQPQMGAPTAAAPTPAPPATSLRSGVTSTVQANQAAAGNAQAAGGAGGGAGGGGAAGAFGPLQFAFSLKSFHQEEHKERTFEYTMQQAVSRHVSPQGMFSTVIDGLNLDKSIRRVSLDDDFFKRLLVDVSMGADLAALSIDSVTVNLEYPAQRPEGKPPTTTGGFEFRPGDKEAKRFQSWLEKNLTRDYRYQVHVQFGAAVGGQGREASVTSPWITASSPRLAIDPMQVVDLLPITVMLSGIDPETVNEVHVDLRYDGDPSWTPQTTLRLNPKNPEPKSWPLRIDQGGSRAFSWRATYLLPGNARVQTDWMASASPDVNVESPFAGSIDLVLTPLLPAEEVSDATIEIVYTDAARGYTRKHREEFEAGTARRDLSIPTLAAAPGSFSYRVNTARLDGTIYDSGPQTAAADVQRIVVSDGQGKVRRIKLQLPNADLGTQGLAALRVAIQTDDDSDGGEVLFTASQTAPQTLTLVDGGNGRPGRYHYTVTGYDERGLPHPGASGESTSATFIIPAVVS